MFSQPRTPNQTPSSISQTPSSISSYSTEKESYESDDDSDFLTSPGVNLSRGLPHSSLHNSTEEWGDPIERLTPADVKLMIKFHKYSYNTTSKKKVVRVYGCKSHENCQHEFKVVETEHGSCVWSRGRHKEILATVDHGIHPEIKKDVDTIILGTH